MAQVYLNGDFLEAGQARISPLDRGFLFADGVYEVIPAFNGVLFRLEEQERLNHRPLGTGRPGDAWKTLARHYIEFKRRLCGLS